MTGEFKGSPLDAQTTNDYADFRRESVGNAFPEAAVFELALKTHGTANVHGQFVQGEFGKDTIDCPSCRWQTRCFQSYVHHGIKLSDQHYYYLRRP